ncbi:MAG TPA: rhomboid family intramembrane serine protease [Woeseiaceae bacterium]|nr:rhomboid family intramembrane serine protease [Woeseiaceae bacterium]
MQATAVVFDSVDPRAASDRALVLHSLDIPCEIVRVDARSVLVVPAELAERAKFEIWQYDQENRQKRRQPPASVPVHEYHNGLPGVFGYVLVLCAAGWLAGRSAFGFDWLRLGTVDGELIRAGEWWRTLTALTLHAGVGHLLGNIGFGALFGGLAGRLVGSGVAWACIVLAAGAGNALNTVLLESAHRSLGASTAVFAALGLLAGFVWRGRLMAQDRWAYRLGPIVGGIALLAYTGTGDAQTDIGAHLSGFLCGFAAGIALTFAVRHLESSRLQAICGAGALALILAAWAAAFA